jgi:acyl-CoA reductase-like NAD-dependent aldehyde dehydrogenase
MAESPRTTSEVLNPSTGAVIARPPEHDARAVDLAVKKAAKAAAGPWGKSTPRERADALFKLAALIRENADALAKLEAENTGKPIGNAKGEIGYAATVFEYYAGAATKHFGETIPVSNPGLAFTLRQPVGVCALIVPWNFPLVIAAWKLGPALACGNTVVLKPAPETPLTALELVKLAAKAGLPDGVLNVVTGGPKTGAALVAHPQVRKISFTGSTATGTLVMKAAADGIRRVSLELGGKSPNIVFEDADLDVCVEKSLWSVYDNTGQDCCARSRMIVHEKVYGEFVERFVARAKKIVIGDPFKKGVEMGPMISAKQRDKVAGYVDLGKREGATVAHYGGVPKGPGFFISPAVLTGCAPGMRVVEEEIFGPVVCMMPFKTEEQAVALANDSAYGLAGSIWTRDLARAVRLSKAVQAGVLSVNSSSSVYLEAPFGGFKASGLGRELGMKALDAYSETKNVFLSEI